MTRPAFEIWKAGLVFENGIFCGSDYMDRENERIHIIHSFYPVTSIATLRDMNISIRQF